MNDDDIVAIIVVAIVLAGVYYVMQQQQLERQKLAVAQAQAAVEINADNIAYEESPPGQFVVGVEAVGKAAANILPSIVKGLATL